MGFIYLSIPEVIGREATIEASRHGYRKIVRDHIRRIQNMHVTDMVMHIDNNLGEGSRRNVEKALSDARGVIKAHFTERRPHLMLVSYDKERTTSFEILAQLTGQQLCAERVG